MDRDPFDELRDGLRGDAGVDDGAGPGWRVDVRHLLLGGGGVVLIALAVVVLSAARPSPPVADPELLAPSTSTSTSTSARAASPGEADGARVWPGEPVEVVGNEVRSGGHRWSVGAPGDLVAVGDWDCDGTTTPALVRPSTGRLHVFAEWAVDGAESVAAVGADVPTDTTSFEPDGCGAARVHTRSGVRRVEVRVSR